MPTVGDRYRIVKELGRGGMGRVYVAHDLKLERDVAIKVLNPGADGPEQLHRFEQEGRAVASLDHPNVLAIHDIGSHAGSPYIVSELLRGQTLRDRLNAGPLSAHSVLDFALQLAHGIAAAHEKGIVHRDLKPENIYVTDESALKILDFGIAKLVSAAPEGKTLMQTQTGALLGTAEYMSPEQVRGAPVDHRSDIFAFGAILYEMLARKRPFQGKSLIETGYAVLNAEPAPLPEGAPPELKKIARRCLEKDPARRFQSAREVARELEAHAAALAAAEERARSRSSNQRIAGVVLLALLLFAAFAVIWKGPRLWPWAPATPATPAPLTILVGDFDNATSDSVFDGTFEPILTVAMEGAPFVNAFKRQEARKIAAKLKPDATGLDEGTARLVAMRQGIGVVVSGSIRPSGAGYTLKVRAVEPRDGKPIVERQTEVASKAEVLATLENLAAVVRAALGDRTPASASQETFTASSIEAAHEYAAAQDLQHRGRAEEALARYARALALDPRLGRAYAGMAVVNLNLHRRAEAEQYFQKALALIDQMTERERYRTRGTYYVSERDYEKAVDEYTALVTRFPADEVGFVNLAVAHCYRRDMPKAREAGGKALQLAPNNLLNRSNLSVYALYSSDFDEALRLAREVIEANPTYLTPRAVAGLSELASGHPDRAIAAYQAMAKVSKGGASMAAQGVADVALVEGRPHDAIAALQAQLPVDQADNPAAAATKLLALASAQLAIGQPAAAVQALDKAVGLSKAESVLLPAARAYLEAGKEKKARALAAELATRRAKEPQAYARLIEGEILLKGGDSAGAIRVLGEAQRGFDTWIGRFDLGRAYLAAKAYAEAHEELDICLKRRGEAAALFIDEVPTYRYFPATYYYLAKALDGLKSAGSADSYRAFLAIKTRSDAADPLIADAKAQLRSLSAAAAAVTP